jgi:hypothetical protein
MLTSSHATAGYGALSRGRERINMYGSGDEFSLYGYTSVVGSGGEINIAGAVASAATLVGSTSKVKQVRGHACICSVFYVVYCMYCASMYSMYCTVCFYLLYCIFITYSSLCHFHSLLSIVSPLTATAAAEG